jgi:hypothetical protein
MQKQWFVFGSAASIAFALVMVGGIAGHSLAGQTAGNLANGNLPVSESAKLSSPAPLPALDSLREPIDSPTVAPVRRTQEHEQFDLEEHDESAEVD